ncbi:hypothetical protein Tco_0924513 [Tanacetum coccineum]|uniref:Reverse transcriptase domain-containing protein n=1 Tax=Tanacetum coccineum TaxID=301880 RepID=A0ABQ5DAE0_9ASTR
MRTRSQARISVPEPPVRQPSVESSNLEKPDNPPIVTMADNRTMAQLLEAPTEGYEDAIVIPEITAIKRNGYLPRAIILDRKNPNPSFSPQYKRFEQSCVNLWWEAAAAISNKLMSGYRPRWSQIKFEPPGFPPIKNPLQIGHDFESANIGTPKNVQPPVVQIQTRNPNPEPNVAPVVTPVPKASIPLPSRRILMKAQGKS